MITVECDGPIGPASARYLKEALADAAERHAEVVILRLNTSGGLVTGSYRWPKPPPQHAHVDRWKGLASSDAGLHSSQHFESQNPKHRNPNDSINP